MDVSNLLAEDRKSPSVRHTAYTGLVPEVGLARPAEQYPLHQNNLQFDGRATDAYQNQMMGNGAAANVAPGLLNDSNKPGKHVTFELLLHDAPAHRARLPMRVRISPHDTTDSIITTVKNFYGLYEKRGVSFENSTGETLIARYENFEHNMTVYVRAFGEDNDFVDENEVAHSHTRSPRKPRLDEPIHMISQPTYTGSPTRSASRTARRRSASPQSAGSHRSESSNTRSRGRSVKNGPGSHNGFKEEGDSDSDAGASVSSSRRAKAEALKTSEISLENIVEGGRRKRAKFDSSELPLFVPPQVPIAASNSSVSPQRKIGPAQGSPHLYTNQHTFAYTHPLPSPQSYGYSDPTITHNNPLMSTPFSAPSNRHNHRLRTRTGQYPSRHSISTPGVMPTPDPTIGGSVISDEDAALQLMRLGDLSNFSSHGRTSTSTLDDALSGKAEVASSAGETDASDVEDEHTRHDWAGQASDGTSDGEESRGLNGQQDFHVPKKQRLSKGAAPKSVKSRTSSKKSKSVPSSTSRTPISPTSLPPQSRKPSSASLIPNPGTSIPPQQQLAEDEEDLSSKPRCQRCRKSKKGCDRQRPCGRCKDAGIGIEGCISEDEGNGRKGRYGRHMGVTVKKNSESDEPSQIDAPINSLMGAPAPVGGYAMPLAPSAIKGDKKRKR